MSEQENLMGVQNIFLMFDDPARSVSEKIVLGTLMVNQIKVMLMPTILQQTQIRTMMRLGFKSVKGHLCTFIPADVKSVSVETRTENGVAEHIVTFPDDMVDPQDVNDDRITDIFCAAYLGRALKEKENKGVIRKVRDAMQRDITSWTEQLNTEILPTASDEELSTIFSAVSEVIGSLLVVIPGGDSPEVFDSGRLDDEYIYNTIFETMVDESIYRSPNPFYYGLGIALCKIIWANDIADQIYHDTGICMTPDNIKADPLAALAASLMNTFKETGV